MSEQPSDTPRSAAPATAPSGLRVRETSGAEVPLEEQWRDRPALLVFLRHFG